MGESRRARGAIGAAALLAVLAVMAGCGTSTGGTPVIAGPGTGPGLGSVSPSAVRPVDPSSSSVPPPAVVTTTVTPNIPAPPSTSAGPTTGKPTTSTPSTSKPATTVPVDDTTIAPFVGSGLSDGERVIISQLGVVFVNTTAGVTVMQAKTVAGQTLSAKVTFSKGGLPQGSTQTIALTGSTLTIAGPKISVEYTRTPFNGNAIKSYLGDWSGHSRLATVTADGKVKMSMRDYSKDFDAPPLTTEGVLVPKGSGWELRVYLSDNPDLTAGSPFPVTLSQDVLSFGDLTFCGPNAQVGACGA